METMDMSQVTPAMVAMAIIAIGLEWLPGVAAWWLELAAARKARIVALLVLLVSVGNVMGNCYLWGGSCPANWWSTLGELGLAFLLAGVTSQGVYGLARRENW